MNNIYNLVVDLRTLLLPKLTKQWSFRPFATVCLLLIAGTFTALQAQNLNKSVSTPTADPETVFNYTLAFTCPSTTSGDCENVVITDVLPPEVELVNIPVGCGGCSFDPGTNTFTGSLGTIANGGTVSLDIQVQFPANALDGDMANNTASVNFDQNSAPQSETTPPVTTTVTNGLVLIFTDEAVIDKSTSDIAVPGGIASFQLRPSHTSDQTVTELVVEDVFPDGMIYNGLGLLDLFPDCSPTIDYNIEYLVFNTTSMTENWISSTQNPFNTGQDYTFTDHPNSSIVGGYSIAADEYIKGVRFTFLNAPGDGCAHPDFLSSNSRIELIYTFDETITGFPDPMAGDVIQNCADAMGIGLTPSTDCGNTTIRDANLRTFVNKRILAPAPSYAPGDVIRFRLAYGQSPGGDLDIVNPTIVDIIPPGLQYVGNLNINFGGCVSQNPGSTTTDPTIIVENDFDGVPGQTKIEFQWRDADGNGITLPGGQSQFNCSMDVEFDMLVLPSAADGSTLTNTEYAFTDISPSNCSSIDIYDLDGDGDVTDNICQGQEDVAIVYPPGFAGLNSYKEVRGNLDTDFSRFPANGTVSPGGNIEYNLCLENPANLTETIDDLVLVDVLPHVGDRGVVANDELRESAWQPTFTATTLANLQAYVAGIPGATLFFSTECEPCLMADLGPPVTDQPSCSPPNWSMTPPATLSDVCSFKIEFGTSFALAPGEMTCINLNMMAPAGVPTDGSIAWNSFGFVGNNEAGNPLLASEPIKVGIASFPDPCVNPTASLTPNQGTCTGSTPNDDATIDLSSVTDGDIAGIIAGSDYTGGPAYGVANGTNLVDVSGGSGQFSGLMHNTEYTVRVFNGANDCFIDYTVTTPDITCATCMLTDAGLANVTCAGNDAITFDLAPSGSVTGLMYNISVSGGGATSVIPTSGSYGSNTTFTLNDGAAGAGDITITITDADDPSCTLDVVLPNVEPEVLTIVAAASCDDAAGMQVAANTYYVEVSSVSGGNSGPYDVTVAGVTQSFTGTSLFFGPFNHSGVGGAVQVVSATDNGNGSGCVAESSFEVPETLCGINDGGQAPGCFCAGPTTDPSIPTSFIFAQSQPGSFMTGGTSGQVQLYVLTDDMGNIVATNMTGLFEVMTPGTYTPYAINYRLDDQPTILPFLDPGEPIQPILDGVNGTGPLADVCFATCNVDGSVSYESCDCYSVGSTVFTDLDNDGMFEGIDGEQGIQGVTIELLDNAGIVIASTTTDANGDYYFGGLDPGLYSLNIPTPDATYPISSTPTDNADNGEDNDDNGTQANSGDPVTSPTFELGGATPEPSGPAETGTGGAQDDAADELGDMTQDFGFFAPVSVGDFAFLDLNQDGIQTAGEPGVEGVTVTLLDENGIIVTTDAEGNTITGTTTTAPDGSYLFPNLSPGIYSVVFDFSTITDSEFYTFTTSNVGVNDATDSDNSIAIDPTMAQSDPTDFLFAGDMDLTLDVGIVCAVDVTVANSFSICSSRLIDLTQDASITPASLGGGWSTPDGDGVFTTGTDYATATTYEPSANDINRGFVTLVLTTNDPAGVCSQESASVVVNILKVDCGSFLWDGN